MYAYENVKKFLETINEENIKFKQHFYERTLDRPISDALIKKYLKKTENILKVEEQPSKRKDEHKYKIWIKLSNKYSLVVVAAIPDSRKDLYIITGWNTDRKWQKAIQK